MQAHATDPGVFIRSMATRGHLGGLAAATDQALLVLSAAGKDVILVETVGVGQDEVEIVGTADVSLVVLVPGLGDEVQALKAGIMEIADVFVVNKADRDGVERVVAEIESMLSLAAGRSRAPRDREDGGDARRGDGRAARGGRGLPAAQAEASGALAAQAPGAAAAAARGRGAREGDGARLPPGGARRPSSRPPSSGSPRARSTRSPRPTSIVKRMGLA